MRRPPTIVYVGHTSVLSGGELGLLRLIRGTAGRLDAHVILAEDGPLVDVLRTAGAQVTVLELPASVSSVRRGDLTSPRTVLRSAGATVGYIRLLAERLREIAPDVVHTNTLKAGIYGCLAARLAGLPVVWGLHDRLVSDYLPRVAVVPVRLAANTLPSALMVPSYTALSASGRKLRRGLTRAVIPLPVEAPKLAYAVRPTVECVGIVGRLTSWKGQALFLQAFAQAFPTGPVRARIVGSALFGEQGYADSLVELAGDLGISDRVDFVGHRSDIAAELAQLDIMVSASVLPETLGQAIIESIGAGVPTVCPRLGGPTEYATDGLDVLFYPPGDVTALAATLRRLADCPELRARLSSHGPAAVERFSTERVWRDLRALYESLTADPEVGDDERAFCRRNARL